ncbi:MAG: ABC transporter ATP-binding protein, partial [Deltaproteobacteria bacterium HGW-Deltaproteobacteria-11]
GNYSYFIQKRNEMAQADAGGANVLDAESDPSAGIVDLPSTRKSFKTREEKRLEAQERNRLSRITRDLKNELAALEDRIARMETRKAENETTLCAPDIHREPHKIKLLNQEMANLARELEPLYAAWDRMTAEMEPLVPTTKSPP